jgi:hypothetical protein
MKMNRFTARLTTWLYYHARWLYKLLSGYCYDWNCEIEETCEEIRQRIKKLEEQQEINRIIRTRAYKATLT